MSGLILVVEDEKDLADSLAYSFGLEGYQTRVAHTGADALRLVQRAPVPDLVVLDLMLPDVPGTEVCRQLRRDERTARVFVMMVTAKSQEIDRVVGFEVGADDYVVKPFSMRELVLRVKAMLRRGRNEEAVHAENLVFGRIRVDTAGHRVWVDDHPVTLTALEFRLLTTLLSRRGRAQTRDMLLQTVWGIEAEITTRTVDTHVKRLREKLGPAGVYVETLRSVGYRFRSRPDEETP
ncbi:MAG: response regulator transcription factor [Polyangiaceae bacterium]|jgi:two-component system phosphate regulon response regulator PhoB|nr:response regulator transcription factor [Polyangiaceae bacterium]